MEGKSEKGSPKRKDVRNFAGLQIAHGRDERDGDRELLICIHGQPPPPGSGVQAERVCTPDPHPEYADPIPALMFTHVSTPTVPTNAVSSAYSIISCPDSSTRSRNKVLVDAGVLTPVISF